MLRLTYHINIRIVQRMQLLDIRLRIFGIICGIFGIELSYLQTSFSNSIKYHGALKPNNKTEYETLSKYDIFILPTEYPGECLPGALIDAYIAELAVIVSNWKYAKEYVEGNKNGKIFQYGNYDDMYKKTIELICGNDIQKYKQRSKELAQQYNSENVLLKFKTALLENLK